MLRPAQLYKNEIQTKYAEAIADDKNFYLQCDSYNNYELKIDENDWNLIQLVSIDSNNNVTGYFHAAIDRAAWNVTEIMAANFNSPSLSFGRDFMAFIDRLFMHHNFDKINFSCVQGNPAFHIYTRLMRKYEIGRVVGTYKRDIRMPNGKYYDRTFFEILSEEYKSKII